MQHSTAAALHLRHRCQAIQHRASHSHCFRRFCQILSRWKPHCEASADSSPSIASGVRCGQSDAVSSSDPRSGVAGPGTSSLPICSSCLASSISILSLSDSSPCATFAALVGALRLEDRDGPALRGVSVLAVCIACASRRRVSQLWALEKNMTYLWTCLLEPRLADGSDLLSSSYLAAPRIASLRLE